MLNPAATGVLALSLVGVLPGWWGVSFAPRWEIIDGGISVAMFLTVPIAGYVAHKYKKLPTALAAFASFAASFVLLFQTNPLFLIAEGTLAFFILVMVVEPKTSPALRNEQLLYGALVGLLFSVGLKFHWLEPYAIALLTCNAIFTLYKNRLILKTKFAAKPSQIAVNPPN